MGRVGTGRATGGGTRKSCLLLVLLLAVSLDLCTMVTATPWGLAWDDDEEAVRLGRPEALPRRLVLAAPMLPASVTDPAPHRIVRASPQGDRPAAVDLRPRRNLSTEPTAPTEDH
jgi:hypothetical protein